MYFLEVVKLLLKHPVRMFSVFDVYLPVIREMYVFPRSCKATFETPCAYVFVVINSLFHKVRNECCFNVSNG
jgi:hypothetical protein